MVDVGWWVWDSGCVMEGVGWWVWDGGYVMEGVGGETVQGAVWDSGSRSAGSRCRRCGRAFGVRGGDTPCASRVRD